RPVRRADPPRRDADRDSGRARAGAARPRCPGRGPSRLRRPACRARPRPVRGRPAGAARFTGGGDGRPRCPFVSLRPMATVRETLEVNGIRCERCVLRLAKTLEGHDGLEFANANLLGTLTVVYDDARTSREALLGRLERGGFSARAG